MPEPAPAKVNLYLHVTGRRADGYHLLDSLVVFAGAADRLEGEAAGDLALTLQGPFAAGLTAEPNNLVLRAARALAESCDVPAQASLLLTKTLPVASGIGGGSADAAASLRLLCRLWTVNPGPGTLHAIAAGLGADVPVCLGSSAARMQGIGDILAPAPGLPECGIVLVNPGVAVATADVFRARDAAFTQPAILPNAWRDAVSMADGLGRLSNDLQAPAITLCPPIADVLAALRGTMRALLVRMSGSGATCFALYPTPVHAEAAAASLAQPGWWCWGGGLFQAGAVSG